MLETDALPAVLAMRAAPLHTMLSVCQQQHYTTIVDSCHSPSSFLQAEGLVHVSNISSARLGSAKEAVERGQEVWVKVVSVSGGKLGLSIRDVDQATGRDLLDLDKIRAAQGTAGGGVQQQSALMGISGIKVNPKDFEETTKR
jgi:predicted RNA-binding protein with RPS1 domain